MRKRPPEIPSATRSALSSGLRRSPAIAPPDDDGGLTVVKRPDTRLTWRCSADHAARRPDAGGRCLPDPQTPPGSASLAARRPAKARRLRLRPTSGHGSRRSARSPLSHPPTRLHTARSTGHGQQPVPRLQPRGRARYSPTLPSSGNTTVPAGPPASAAAPARGPSRPQSRVGPLATSGSHPGGPDGADARSRTSQGLPSPGADARRLAESGSSSRVPQGEGRRVRSRRSEADQVGPEQWHALVR